MIKKFLLAVSAVLVMSFAHAAQIDTSDLTDAQVAELKAVAASAAAKNAKSKDNTTVTADGMATFVSTWGTQAAQAAEGFARAFGIAAKELNISINDFLNTDAGKLTAALIIWKVAGASILGLLYGMFFVTAGLALARILYLRLFTAGYQKVTYKHMFGAFTGEKMVRIPKSINGLHEDGEWLTFWIMLIVAIGSLLIGAAIIK